jgi:hypothetical protein
MSLRVVPLNLDQANLLISLWHRHHTPVVNHRYSLGAIDDSGVAHGAVIVAQPVSQHSGPAHEVAEVTRLVTDGTRNACSILYAAAARAARHMGYTRIQTFILAAEPGTSLKASGWVSEGATGGNSWGSRPGRNPSSLGPKERWVLHLNPPPPPLVLPVDPDAPVQETLTLGVMS